jgi:hypothetical protein
MQQRNHIHRLLAKGETVTRVPIKFELVINRKTRSRSA